MSLVSKELYTDNTSIDAWRYKLLKIQYIKENGFEEDLIDASELAKALFVKPVFKIQDKRLHKRRKLFDYESADEHLSVHKTDFSVQSFNQVVDKALQRVMAMNELKSIKIDLDSCAIFRTCSWTP